MKKLLFLLPLTLLVFGCAKNHFNVPVENFTEKVRVLGIVPIIVDSESDIKYPQKEQLIALLTETNRKYEQQLVRKIKATGNFYTVALMGGDPQRTFNTLLFRREKRDDASIHYNKYFWKTDELREYLRKNNLDGLMLIVVSGLTKTDKVFSSNLLTSLTTDYNFLAMSAQIVDGNSTILWEYPNFRSRVLTYDPLTNLQYPDFSEAEANLSSKAELKFKTLEGIRRTLEQKRKDLLLRETQEPEIYGKQFDEMLSYMKYDRDKDKKDDMPPPRKELPKNQVTPANAIAPAEPAKTVEPVAVPKAAVPPVDTPAPQAPPVPKPAPASAQSTDTSSLTPDEIVPATGSTL